MANTILDIVDRTLVPAPWSEGDNIPWDDPEFSERMLAEHLSQEHHLASRKSGTINQQVEWIFSEVLGSRPVRVLDLACGPGLYALRLAGKGCDCVGIDFFSVIVARTGAVSTYALSNEAYTVEKLSDAIRSAGFKSVERFPALSGTADSTEQSLPVVVARS